MKYSFVIPCYNSSLSISHVVKEIQDKMLEMQETEYEIILVNDHSKDNTKEVIFGLADQPNIRAISLAKNSGQDAACLCGYKASTGDYVISLDDDGQNPANEVDKLIDKLNEGYDVVIAHYPNKQHESWRNIGSKVNDIMEIEMLGKPKELYVGSYFIAKRFIIDQITQYTNPYPYIRGLLLSATDNIANVDVHHRSREFGTSQYTLKKLLGLWVNGFTSFSVKPLRFSTLIGAMIALLGFIMTLYAVIHKLLHPEISAGWASLMSVTTLIGGMILLMLGMIGEYVGRIYISINHTPQYVIQEKKNFD
ncbi:MAG: glycosyltransferase family 2 protein [Erysipelotrichaceae bacterium]|nr:glycosyltransferase family 2 protein [Erysipelotrichaceae bacterium]MDO5121043.1 glycosyltransferase family 2 protein [Erysipelotrichaceae bacterium]